MAVRRLAVHYDVISPYSWIGFEQILRHNHVWKNESVKVELKPTFISGIMAASGNKPPGVVPSKMTYMMHDLSRFGEYYDIPIKPIKDPFTTLFKKGSTKAMRVLTAIDQEDPKMLENTSIEIWKQIWHRDLDITDDLILSEAMSAAGVAPEAAKKYLEMTQDPEIKKRLTTVTQEAIDAQAFGAPTYIIREDGKDDLMFFGQDRIELICASLGTQYLGAALEGKERH